MDGWQDRLHISFLGEHFLLGGLRIDSFRSFSLASLITIGFCFSERMLTLTLSKHWTPFPSIRRSRLRVALWRTLLYWLVTFNRLIYMLIAMTFHLGIILVTVTALSAGQLIIEYVDAPPTSTASGPNRSYVSYRSPGSGNIKEPLLNSLYPEEDDEATDFSSEIPLSVSRQPLQTKQESSSVALTQSVIATRPRSRSKPDEIFIHPAQSNIMRAEALAIQYGLGAGDSELVDASSYTTEVPIQNQFNVEDSHRLARELLIGHGPKDSNTFGPSRKNDQVQLPPSDPE